MKWEGRRQSDNMEDRRGGGMGKTAAVGGGALGIIVLLISMFMGGGGDNAQLLDALQQSQQQQDQGGGSRALSAEEQAMGQFVATVLADTEDVWNKIFQENGQKYQEPKLVLFDGRVDTECGSATSDVGPFYCPADQKVYMDLAFFEELRTKFGAKGGDFAIAYVIAHEIGHHVQNLLGTSGDVHRKQQKMSEAKANKLSVCLELQADFYAGVWIHHNEAQKQVLEGGDIEEALSAAHAVGDDAIQSRIAGRIVPESFTHGTSEQRKYWFMRGFKTGDVSQGNTFAEVR